MRRMRGGDRTPLSSGLWESSWSVLGNRWYGCCHGGARGRRGWFGAGVALCRGVDFSRRGDQGIAHLLP